MPVKKYDGTNWVTVAGDGAQGPTGPAGASATTVVTTKGDLLGYSTTAARLPVGTNNQVLTADSAEATGLKWATPTTGGMTLLSTTNLSGSSTTISGISGSYKNLLVYVKNYQSSANYGLLVQINSDTTGSNYSAYVLRASSGTASPYADNTLSGYDLSGYALSSSGTSNFAALTYYDYANTGTYKTVEGVNIGLDNNGSGKDITKGVLGWWSTAAISQLVFKLTVGTFTAGTVEIYGVK